jgi:uroporphyrinogen-III synthase
VLRGALVVAVGPRTASALDSLGVAPINVPDRADAEGVLDWILASPEGPRRSWVLPRAEGGRPTIEDGLRAQGWRVEPVVAYRTVPLRDGAPLRQAVREGLAAVTFAASSAVTTFIDLLGSGLLLDGVAVVTIGPSTSATSRTHGLPVAAEADAPSIAALVDAVRRALGTP